MGAKLIATWCPHCGTEHRPRTNCPRGIQATGPEKPCWRVSVETPQGIRGYGVLSAKAGTRWRTRIVTFPNILWMVPGRGESLKFLHKREDEAIRHAVDFIRRHCVTRGYTLRDEVVFVESAKPRPFNVGATDSPKAPPRIARRLQIRFGRSRPTLLGETANLSETGLFIVTSNPLYGGEQLGMSLELEHCKVPLRGAVAWNRQATAPGRDAGMGLALVSPPAVYVKYVRALG